MSDSVRHIEKRGDTHIVIATNYDVSAVDMGASIACSGVCMTVVDKGTRQGPLVRGHRLGRDAVQDDAGRLEGRRSGQSRTADARRRRVRRPHRQRPYRRRRRSEAGRAGRRVHALHLRGAGGAVEVHRAQGLGRARRRVADGERGRRHALRRQHHSAHAEGHDLRPAQAGREGQSRRSTCWRAMWRGWSANERFGLPRLHFADRRRHRGRAQRAHVHPDGRRRSARTRATSSSRRRCARRRP